MFLKYILIKITINWKWHYYCFSLMTLQLTLPVINHSYFSIFYSDYVILMKVFAFLLSKSCVPISSQCSHSLNHILFSHLLSRFILCGALTPAFSVKLSGIYRTTADDCNFVSSYSDSEAERVRRLKLTQIVEFFNLLL